MLEIVAVAIKIIASALSGVFGAIGTIHEYKQKDGRVTKFGKIALWGLSISVFFAVSAQIFEATRDQLTARNAAEEALRATQQMQDLLEGVDRNLRRIESYRVFLVVNANSVEVDTYVEFLKPLVKSAMENGPFSDENLTLSTDGPGVKTFDVHAQYEPEEIGTWLISKILTVNRVELAIYRDPIDPTEHRPFSGASSEDLEVDLSPSYGDRMGINYHLNGEDDDRDDHIGLSGAVVSEDPSRWDSNGEMLSIPDFTGAQIFIAFGPLGVAPGGEEFTRARSHFEIDAINFQVNNRSVWIDPESLKKHATGDGVTYWSYTFPTAGDPFDG